MNAKYPLLPAALIFNPASGAADDGRKFHATLQELLAGVNIEATSFRSARRRRVGGGNCSAPGN